MESNLKASFKTVGSARSSKSDMKAGARRPGCGRLQAASIHVGAGSSDCSPFLMRRATGCEAKNPSPERFAGTAAVGRTLRSPAGRRVFGGPWHIREVSRAAEDQFVKSGQRVRGSGSVACPKRRPSAAPTNARSSQFRMSGSRSVGWVGTSRCRSPRRSGRGDRLSSTKNLEMVRSIVPTRHRLHRDDPTRPAARLISTTSATSMAQTDARSPDGCHFERGGLLGGNWAAPCVRCSSRFLRQQAARRSVPNHDDSRAESLVEAERCDP